MAANLTTFQASSIPIMGADDMAASMASMAAKKQCPMFYVMSPEDLAVAQLNTLRVTPKPRPLSMKQQQQMVEYSAVVSPTTTMSFPQTPQGQDTPMSESR
jgi:hypothetical protein